MQCNPRQPSLKRRGGLQHKEKRRTLSNAVTTLLLVLNAVRGQRKPFLMSAFDALKDASLISQGRCWCPHDSCVHHISGNWSRYRATATMAKKTTGENQKPPSRRTSFSTLSLKPVLFGSLWRDHLVVSSRLSCLLAKAKCKTHHTTRLQNEHIGRGRLDTVESKAVLTNPDKSLLSTEYRVQPRSLALSSSFLFLVSLRLTRPFPEYSLIHSRHPIQTPPFPHPPPCTA